MPQQSNKGRNIIILILLFVIILLCCCSLSILVMATDSSVLGDYEVLNEEGNELESVAIIHVAGTIMNSGSADLFGNVSVNPTEDIINKLDRAENDPNVKAVILKVDSPGGSAYASRLIYNKIKEVQASEKPVVTLMGDVAASGGYYVSAPTDHIVASQTTMTGSIGVLIGLLDTQELYDKLGIKEIYITNSEGNLKVIKSFDDPESEGYKVYQSVLDDTYDQFVEVIAEGRNMTTSEVVAVADGRIYSGKQAMEVGLVDELGEMAEAKEAVKEIADLSNPQFIIYTEESSSFSFSNFRLFKELSAILNKDANSVEVLYMLQT